MMSYGDPSWREWTLDEDAAAPFVRYAVESGITFFDTADVYSLGVSEEVTGRLLAKYLGRRDDYVLATKVFNTMGPGDTGRGDDGGAARRRTGGQGPISRRVEHVRLAVREGTTGGQDSVRVHACCRRPHRQTHAAAPDSPDRLLVSADRVRLVRRLDPLDVLVRQR
jgi:hypothetical protein